MKLAYWDIRGVSSLVVAVAVAVARPDELRERSAQRGHGHGHAPLFAENFYFQHVFRVLPRCFDSFTAKGRADGCRTEHVCYV